MITYELCGFGREAGRETIYFLIKHNGMYISEIKIHCRIPNTAKLGSEFTHEQFEQFLNDNL